jgi:hypothetical protein
VGLLPPGAREVQIGSSIRVANAWELFGNDHWVWFTGAVASFRGAIQIVSQWAERENLGPRDRVWQWVHWKNPTNDDVVVKPFLLLAPPIADRALMQSSATPPADPSGRWSTGSRRGSRPPGPSSRVRAAIRAGAAARAEAAATAFS